MWSDLLLIRLSLTLAYVSAHVASCAALTMVPWASDKLLQTPLKKPLAKPPAQIFLLVNGLTGLPGLNEVKNNAVNLLPWVSAVS